MTYFFFIVLAPGVRATDALKAVTASGVRPSTTTPEVLESRRWVTRRDPGGSPNARSAHPPTHSAELLSWDCVGSLEGLLTTKISSSQYTTRRRHSSAPSQQPSRYLRGCLCTRIRAPTSKDHAYACAGGEVHTRRESHTLL